MLFFVTSYSSGIRCEREKVRHPGSVCTTRQDAIPERITLQITKDKKGNHFTVVSECRVMKGEIKTDENDRLILTSTSLKDHCGNRNLSMFHDAVFTRLLEIEKLVNVGSNLQGIGRAKVDLTLSPIDASFMATR